MARRDQVAVRSGADAAQVKRAGRRDRERLEQEATDLRSIVGTQQGRRVLWRLLVKLGLKDSCYDPDPIRMAALNGARESALWMESEINAVSDTAMAEMRRESLLREKNDAVEEQAMQTESATANAEAGEDE